jgi:hypothetical protein
MTQSPSPQHSQIWSIGIYTGESPVSLRPSPNVQNPVLTHAHVTDIAASFVADPFMVHENGIWYMFFEVLNAVTGLGEIGLATSPNATDWVYRQIVLKKPYHLSYPYVFQWQDDYYMTPETLTPGAIRLYRAERFPTSWVWVADLVPGRLADPSPFRLHDRWWMLACGTPYGHDMLRLFDSAHLTHGWRESPGSPLIRNNRHIARPAGRVTPWGGGVIRYAQDCYPTYGNRVHAFFAEDFAGSPHQEVEMPAPVLLPDPAGDWASSGMHHVDPHPISSGTWVACVDGSKG